MNPPRRACAFRAWLSSATSTYEAGPRGFVTKFEHRRGGGGAHRCSLRRSILAALGKSVQSTNRFYKLWNIAGSRYYTYAIRTSGSSHSTAMPYPQCKWSWLEASFYGASRDEWNISTCHHPLYSTRPPRSAVDFEGPRAEFRQARPLVFPARHIYERECRNGHRLLRLRRSSHSGGDVPSPMTAAAFDQTRFHASLSRGAESCPQGLLFSLGATVDSGQPRETRP